MSLLTFLLSATLALSQSTRCGVTWQSAQTTCGQPCIYSDDACPLGQHCFASLDTSACTSGPATQPVSSFTDPTRRCGVSWEQANSRCGGFCWDMDGQCSNGEKCFADLNAGACNGVGQGMPAVTTGVGIDGGGLTTTTANANVNAGLLTTQAVPVVPTTTTEKVVAVTGPDTSPEITIPNSTTTSIIPIQTSVQATQSILLPTTQTTTLMVSATTTATTTTIKLDTNGLPLLPSCATGCFTTATLFDATLPQILKAFCANETSVATNAYKCALNPCTSSTDQQQTVAYLNAIGEKCTNAGQGTPGWKFSANSTTSENDSGSGGLSGLWIGLIVLFVALFLAILIAVVWMCCCCCRRRKVHRKELYAEERRDHYNHVHVDDSRDHYTHVRV